MALTDDNFSGSCKDALQIDSIKIASIRGGLRWPLDVFGMVVARDVLDNRKRNIIFARARTNCQTITEEHPYLELTGPTRAVVACLDPRNIEVMLKVKAGAAESEDRDLSFLALTLKHRGYCSYDEDYTSKRSTLELTFRHIESSVEATISVQLVGGSSWPEGFQGVFTVSIASIDDAEIVLLDFDNKLPVVGDSGVIKLSRRVVSVEHRKGRLKVSVVARREKGEDIARSDDIVFTSKYVGRSRGVVDVGSCKLQVTVAWSVFNRYS
ncbi:uncharacterized protein LOC112270543 [Brachypodium distachyon]|uniref:DUF6598 domain-containing protein n=1 Tax=Brachypodium distachyon TaxID=15368 RepID=A0A0Q3QMP0_BRADI|nr:uncharacterized protein LOC112270543 [Brachypodium distachyon]KQK02738.1 hypothetical protein BRADI_2g03374v3 [Brachypodium distachyon]|eukprot:XP_024313954.1 uncharacterized protein LOC112270543 [Brachypodium distachyon]